MGWPKCTFDTLRVISAKNAYILTECILEMFYFTLNGKQKERETERESVCVRERGRERRACA